MEQKVVLITGGSTGIGRAIGELLAQKGFVVYGTTRNLVNYPNFQAFQLLELDVRNQATIDRTISKIIEVHGKIDILINNAGIGITGPLEETPIDAIENVFDINFMGPIRLMKSVMPNMRKHKNGLIINITSIAGYMGLPFRGIYSSSKGALGVLTEAIRMEAKQFGVHLVTLAPGDFATNIAAGRYTVEPEEDSDYFGTYKMSLDLMNDHVDSGGDPQMVANKIFRIISSANPKPHYKVGAFMQRISVLLKRILPGYLFERLLLNHYKL